MAQLMANPNSHPRPSVSAIAATTSSMSLNVLHNGADRRLRGGRPITDENIPKAKLSFAPVDKFNDTQAIAWRARAITVN